MSDASETNLGAATAATQDVDVTVGKTRRATSWRRILTSLTSAAPQRLQGYFELAKPRVNLLVGVVAGVGFLLGSPGPIVLPVLTACLIGTLLLGAGASALNQYLERDLDSCMRRTRNRPLPTGRLVPFEALAIGLAFGVCGVLVLALGAGGLASVVGAVTYLSYVLLYTPCKRFSAHAVFVGAVPGALPPLIGWAAASGDLPPQAWSLFTILFVWQIPHVLAIAWLFREDYAAAGFPTFATGDETGRCTARLVFWSSILLLAVSWLPVALGVTGGGGLYLSLATVVGLLFLSQVVRFYRQPDRARARRVVLVSILHVPAVFVFLLLDRLL